MPIKCPKWIVFWACESDSKNPQAIGTMVNSPRPNKAGAMKSQNERDAARDCLPPDSLASTVFGFVGLSIVTPMADGLVVSYSRLRASSRLHLVFAMASSDEGSAPSLTILVTASVSAVFMLAVHSGGMKWPCAFTAFTARSTGGFVSGSAVCATLILGGRWNP